MAADPRSFAIATGITQTSSHTYIAQFPDTWCIGSVPHGGYITSCFMRVGEAHFRSTLRNQNQPHLMTIHLEFLRRTEIGEGVFSVKDVKLGRQTSIIYVSLTQSINSGPVREEVIGYLTHTNLATESGLTLDTKWNLDPPAPKADMKLLRQGKDPNWRELQGHPHSKFRKATTCIRNQFPSNGQVVTAGSDQWNALASGERWTNASLGFLCDMFPQIIEQHIDSASYTPGAEMQRQSKDTGKFWYPTVVLNLEIKKNLPEEGADWLFSRVRAKMVKNGRYDLEVIVVDEVGDVVALSHHVVLVVSAARNLQKRNAAPQRL